MSADEQRFRRAQWTTFAVLFGGYASYTYNRKAVSFALPSLLQNGLLDKSGAGTVASMQNFAYAISKFGGGILSDKVNVKWLFFAGLVISGAATALFSTASSLTLFAALWFLNGFAQGAGWPSCAKLLKRWFSPDQFGTYWSALSASSNVSGSLCPFLAAWIISNSGWRASLLVSGGVTLAFAACVVLVLRESPSQAGFDKDFGSGGAAAKKKTDGDEAVSMTWKDLLGSPFLWLVSACYLVVFAVKTSISDWGQLYILEELGGTAFMASAFTSAVETGGFFGGIAAGLVTDRLTKKRAAGPQAGNPRMTAATWFMAGVSLHLYLLTRFVHRGSSQLVLSAVGFGLGGCLFACIAVFGIVASESYPAHLSGTSHAIASLSANVGAIISGLPCSYFAQVFSWKAVFVLQQFAVTLTTVTMILSRSVSPVKVKTRTD